MSFNKILTALIVIVILIGGFFYLQSTKVNAPTNDGNNSTQPPPPSMTPTPAPSPTPDPSPTPATSDKPVATIETSLGTFQVTLEAKAAPKTVENFVSLSKDGFYNNLTFHRIVKQDGFHLIQGGDPKGDGTGGPGYTVPAEIGLKHTKGAIATARTGDSVNPNRESSGSQFYITEEDIPFLDGQYTVFGYVTSGMDVVLKIGQVATDASDKPITPVIIKKITIK